MAKLVDRISSMGIKYQVLLPDSGGISFQSEGLFWAVDELPKQCKYSISVNTAATATEGT